MKYAEAIILTLILILIFAVFFGWCLHRTCRRVVDAEVQELEYVRDAEAKAEGSGKGEGSKKGSGKGSGKGSEKGKKAESKKSEAVKW